jgi:heme/copper-type cytochrome/quinol oxidase subunit 2
MVKTNKRMESGIYAFFGILASFMICHSATAAEPIVLQIKNHLFVPKEITLPTNTRVKVEVQNMDDTPAEFESSDMKVEKIVVPGGKITVNLGPLKPGTYKFFDEYHPDTATGTVRVAAE